MEKEMEKGKNIIIKNNYYLKETIKMDLNIMENGTIMANQTQIMK